MRIQIGDSGALLLTVELFFKLFTKYNISAELATKKKNYKMSIKIEVWKKRGRKMILGGVHLIPCKGLILTIRTNGETKTQI